MRSIILHDIEGGVDVAPAAIGLAGADVELAGAPARERRLRRLLEPLVDDYDLIFIDCPPSLGLLTVNALTAADAVLIPLQSEYYALEGLTQLLATIDLVRDHLNPRLAIDGVVMTMADARTNLSSDVEAEARAHLGRTVYETVIPRSVRLCEAPSHGKSIASYAPDLAVASPTRRWRRVPSTTRSVRRKGPDRYPDRALALTWWRCHDSSTRTRTGPWTRPLRADPAAPGRPGWRCRDPDRGHPTKPEAAPPTFRRGGDGHARCKHPRARRAPAHPRDRDDRRLPAGRRRAPRSRRARRRSRAHPRASSASSDQRRNSSSRSSRTSSVRTSIPSRPRMASASWSTISVSRTSRSPRASAGPARPSPIPCACSTLLPVVQAGDRRAPDHRRTRPRARRAIRRAPGARPRHRRRPGPLGPPDRGARSSTPRAEGRAAPARRHDPPRPIPTLSASRRTSVGRSARRSAWPGRGEAAAS